MFDILGHLLAIVLAQAFPSGRPSADDVRQIQLLNEALELSSMAPSAQSSRHSYLPQPIAWWLYGAMHHKTVGKWISMLLP